MLKNLKFCRNLQNRKWDFEKQLKYDNAICKNWIDFSRAHFKAVLVAS